MYSQNNEEQIILNYFSNQPKGTFLDIGANDGVLLSNSYFFEKELDWNGICFEPIPSVYSELIKNRSCTCVCGCVSEKSGKKIDSNEIEKFVNTYKSMFDYSITNIFIEPGIILGLPLAPDICCSKSAVGEYNL